MPEQPLHCRPLYIVLVLRVVCRSAYYQRYQEPPQSPKPRSAVAEAYAASVASRVIQPPVMDFRETHEFRVEHRTGRRETEKHKDTEEQKNREEQRQGH